MEYKFSSAMDKKPCMFCKQDDCLNPASSGTIYLRKRGTFGDYASWGPGESGNTLGGVGKNRPEGAGAGERNGCLHLLICSPRLPD